MTVRVEAGEPADWARAVVADDGPGMSPQDAARVFDRLYQTANKAGKGLVGLELGLFIAKELAARQGGSLTLETEKGPGCRFTLLLPTAAAWPATSA